MDGGSLPEGFRRPLRQRAGFSRLHPGAAPPIVDMMIQFRKLIKLAVRPGRGSCARVLALTALCASFVCGGFDGSDVVEVKDFEADLRRAEQATILRCVREVEGDAAAQALGSALGTGLAAGFYGLGKALDKVSLGASERYVTARDRDLCVQAVLTVPCSRDWNISLGLSKALYCHPVRASLWQAQHPGQGEWSTPTGGPRL